MQEELVKVSNMKVVPQHAYYIMVYFSEFLEQEKRGNMIGNSDLAQVHLEKA